MTKSKEVYIHNDKSTIKEIFYKIGIFCVGFSILWIGAYCYVNNHLILGIGLVSISIFLPVYLKMNR